MLAELLLASALLSGSPSAPAAASQLLPVEQNIIQQTNAQRQRYGLPPLTIDAGLLQSARRHASWMARVNSLTHTSAAVAENIAMGQSSSQQAVRDWMNSPGHRANILNGGYRRVGAAAYTSSSGATYWCLQLLH
jgi:uncharacterized protein YkwD